MTRWLSRFAALLALAAAPVPAAAQRAEPAEPSIPRVYLDCSDCFQEFLRDEIDWVDFVRQQEDADVHVLATETTTGSGGRETVLRLVGRGRFAGITRELRVLSMVNEAESLRRDAVLRTVTAGLIGFVADGGVPPGFEVRVETDGAGRESAPDTDRWNLWVFELGGGGELEAEESNRESQWEASFAGDRVSERWKIALGLSVERQRETFNLDEEDPLEIEQREWLAEWFVARSAGPHWSIGLDGRVESSTFTNTRVAVRAAPAVEFSIFPYREYASRQLTIQYQIGLEHSRYYEMTLFDRLRETLTRHQLGARLDQRQTWGSLEASLEWSQYLQDASSYGVEAEAEVSVNVARGLAVEIDGSASRLHDQISIPRRGATPEEVLLELRELQSAYDVRLSVGVTYSFGSLFNNVVNPRFGDRN